MLEMGINDLWIGANDIHREGTMVWVSDKTNVSKGFSNWHPGEPNNSRSSEHCGNYYGFIVNKYKLEQQGHH
jgi:hypothetical protein